MEVMPLERPVRGLGAWSSTSSNEELVGGLLGQDSQVKGYTAQLLHPGLLSC